MKRSEIVAWIGLAGVVRAIVAWQTLVPARDAATYLWMADRIAEGHAETMFDSVFHPLYPLLVADVASFLSGISTVTAGKLVACGAATLAIAPLMAASRILFGSVAARAAALFYACGIWFARHPADCMTEGVFLLVVALAAWLIARERDDVWSGLGIGVLGALGFGLRPEGAAIALLGVTWLTLRRARLAAVVGAAAFAVGIAPWIAGWTMLAGEFVFTPKASFSWRDGAGGATDGIVHYLSHLLSIPGESFEAIGYVALPLAVYGAIRARPIGLLSPEALLLALFALQCLVIPGLRSDIRFVTGYGALLLPFAGHGATFVLARLRAWSPIAIAALTAVAIAGDLVRIPQVRRANRVVLIELGEFLGRRLGPNDRIATEMPRLLYFADLRPGEPRAIPHDRIMAMCRAPATRFVAVVSHRTGVTAAELGPLGFEPVELPTGLRQLVEARGILVLARAE